MRSLIRDVTVFSSVIPATVQGLFRSGLQVCKTVFDSFGQDVRGAAKVCEIHVFIWIVAAILIADKDHASGDAHFRESCAIVTSAGWKTDVINTALYCRRGQTALDLGGHQSRGCSGCSAQIKDNTAPVSHLGHFGAQKTVKVVKCFGTWALHIQGKADMPRHFGDPMPSRVG